MAIETKNRLAGAIQLAFQGAGNPTVGFTFGFRIEVGVSPVRTGVGVYEVQLLPDAYGQVNIGSPDVLGGYVLSSHWGGSVPRVVEAVLTNTGIIPLPGLDTLRILTFDSSGVAADSDGTGVFELRAVPFDLAP